MTKMTSMLLGFALTISAATVPASAAFAADGDTSAPITLDHQGRHYVYTVTEAGDTRIISGVEERNNQPFELRVNGRTVRGHFGGVPVAFRTRRSDAGDAATEVAVR